MKYLWASTTVEGGTDLFIYLKRYGEINHPAVQGKLFEETRFCGWQRAGGCLLHPSQHEPAGALAFGNHTA